jgi:hypothetical protein
MLKDGKSRQEIYDIEIRSNYVEAEVLTYYSKYGPLPTF